MGITPRRYRINVDNDAVGFLAFVANDTDNDATLVKEQDEQMDKKGIFGPTSKHSLCIKTK